MRIKRVFNNNAVIAYKDDGEVVVFGRGVGFQKKHGDRIDPQRVEKIFTTTDKQSATLGNLLRDIPLADVELTTHIVKQAESDLQVGFGSSTFIAVLDHVSFALKRAKRGLFITNPLLWETRGAYPDEYRAAQRSLSIIEEETGVRLPADEAGALALHYFNAQDPSRHMRDSYRTVELIKEVIETARKDLAIELDEDGMDFNRLMTHLRFFVNGLFGTDYRPRRLDDTFLFDQMKGQYPDVYECVEHICQKVKERLGVDVGDEDELYLMIHIQRLIKGAGK